MIANSVQRSAEEEVADPFAEVFASRIKRASEMSEETISEQLVRLGAIEDPNDDR